LHRLAGDLRDQVVVTVVLVQHRDTFPLGHGRDQQVGQADRSHTPAAPQGSLDLKRTPPVLIMGGQPLIPSVAVGSELIELSAAPRPWRRSQLDRRDRRALAGAPATGPCPQPNGGCRAERGRRPSRPAPWMAPLRARLVILSDTILTSASWYIDRVSCSRLGAKLADRTAATQSRQAVPASRCTNRLAIAFCPASAG
jgi:hypothetical protein